MLSSGTASNILIGQYLGENKFMEAINAKNITYTLTIIVIICSSSVVLLFHHWIPYLFSIEKKVLPLARHGLLLIAAVNILDGLFVVQASIIKAW